MVMAKSVAFLLFKSFEQLDFFGPASIFGSKRLNSAYQVFTVAEKAGPVPSSNGVSIIVDHDFERCPKADILVVVGVPDASADFNVARRQVTGIARSMHAPCRRHGHTEGCG